jgi:hypothetical protein
MVLETNKMLSKLSVLVLQMARQLNNYFRPLPNHHGKTAKLPETPLICSHQSRVQSGWTSSLSSVFSEDHLLTSFHVKHICPLTNTAAQIMAFVFNIDWGPHPCTPTSATRLTMWPPEKAFRFSIERGKERKLNLSTAEETAAKVEEPARCTSKGARFQI